jgi:hypothetical protein
MMEQLLDLQAHTLKGNRLNLVIKKMCRRECLKYRRQGDLVEVTTEKMRLG